jgi:tetratricopeptide (TPR) repeat protein
MSQPPKAIFLSYASQDAEAARRLCETLRAAGVEVWFDVEGGLETGDEWDTKIRRQIKECVLFLPVISENTQAREEGYFRIEWDLAAERARGIASGVPFILPIVIDDTRQPDALVPDRFRSVQWTKAIGGELAPEAVAKLAKLWSHRAGLAKHKSAAASAPADETALPAGAPAQAPVPPARRISPAWIAVAGVLVAGLGVAAWFLTAHRAAPVAVQAGASPTGPTASPTAPAPRDWPSSPELKRAVALLDGLQVIPEDFRLAEEIAARELERRPTDPETVTVMARVHSMWLLRGWDRSTARYQKAKSTAERALQLAPDEPEALIALALFYYSRNVELPRALELAQRAVELRPDEPRFHRIRDNCLFNLHVPATNVFLDLTEERETPGLRAALDSARRTVQLFPRDPITRYELARHYRDLGRWADFERVNEETLALYPVANALVWKARARFGLHGDLPGMKQVLDQVPARVRAIERTVFGYFLYAAFTGEVDVGLEALNGFTDPWMIDFDFRGPKALLVASLLEIAGKKELARVQYGLALTELTAARTRNPEDVANHISEAWILHGLGRTEEARAALRTFSEAMVRPHVQSPLSTWWFSAIPAHLLMGERAQALTLIREAIAAGNDGRQTIRLRLELDPRLASWRKDAEINALLAEPAKSEPAKPATEGEQLAARAKAIYTKLGYTREDLATAEDLARRAVELEPGSAAAWGVRAGVQANYLFRNWDFSDKRRQDIQAFAGRALGLNPDEPEALHAMGHLLRHQGATAAAVASFRRGLAAEPTNSRIARALGTTLSFDGNRQEGRAILEAAVQRDPRDPLLRYDLALTYGVYIAEEGTPAAVAQAMQHLDAGLAAQPLSTLLIAKTVLEAGWLGDLPAAQATLAQLEKLPLTDRSEDRAVFVSIWAALLDRDGARVPPLAGLTAKDYFEDSVIPRRPKAWSVALARRLENKESLARLSWQQAENVLRQRLASDPTTPVLQAELATTLAWLGRTDEALSLIAPIEAAAREEPSTRRSRVLADFYAALGDAAKAAPYLRHALNRTVFYTSHTVARDPWFDKLRGQPEFEAVLREVPEKK